MDLIPAALIGFIFVCLAMPQLVKNRPQFFMAIWGAALLILLLTLGMMFTSAMHVFMVIAGFVELLVFFVLVMCAGGLSMQALGGEMGRAYEVMRRGETEKSVIIPLGEDLPKVRKESPEEPRERINLTDSPSAPSIPLSPQPPRKPESGSIPLE